MSVEAWLSGAIERVPPLLMPVAHALIQAKHDVRAAAQDLTIDELWQRPGGAASIGFHLRHIPGSMDRLLTYAHGMALSDAQLAASKQEAERIDSSAAELLDAVDAAIDRAIDELRRTKDDQLLEHREVGRQKLPSTVLGLLFHIAEHTQRHVGQVIVTAKVVRSARNG